MKHNGIENLVRLNLTTEQISKLSIDEQKLLFCASLITNDLSFLMSDIAALKYNSTSIDIKSMQNVRWLWSIRKLLSAIFESQLALRKFSGKVPYMNSYLNEGKKFPFLQPRSGEFLAIAKKIRDDSTYHYDPKKDIIETLSLSNPVEMHFHWASEKGTKSVSGLYDGALFLANLGSESGSVLHEISTWSYTSSGEIMAFCDFCLAEIVKVNGHAGQLELIQTPILNRT